MSEGREVKVKENEGENGSEGREVKMGVKEEQ